MSDELFPPESVAMLSPKLAWMARHEVITFHFDVHEDSGEFSPWLAGFKHWWGNPYSESGGAFFCQETGHNGDSRLGEGDTEDEAIAHLCRRHKIPTWNEEAGMRDAWMARHSVRYSKRPSCYTVWSIYAPMEPFTALGLDEALGQLAAKNGWPMWNEVGA